MLCGSRGSLVPKHVTIDLYTVVSRFSFCYWNVGWLESPYVRSFAVGRLVRAELLPVLAG
jgi:hypothetical protein